MPLDLSFPCRRESSISAAFWIPASAGMTTLFRRFAARPYKCNGQAQGPAPTNIPATTQGSPYKDIFSLSYNATDGAVCATRLCGSFRAFLPLQNVCLWLPGALLLFRRIHL
jgi:hypothetical protein